MNDKSRLDEVKVGAFVLAALVMWIVGSLWIAGSQLLGVQRVSYVVLLKDAGGVQTGDRVRMAGVPVGRIQRIRLRPEQEWPVALQVTVKSDVPVKTDSSARIGTSGLLGAAFVQLGPGSPDAPLLPPGGEIRGGPGAGLETALAGVDEVLEKVGGLLDQASEVLDQVSGEIGPLLENAQRLLSAENSENLRGMLASLRETADDAAPRLSELLARLESIAERAEGTVEGLPELTERVSSLLESAQAALGPDGSRLARVLEAAESSLSSADGVLSALDGNRDELAAMVRDLRDTVANLKAFSQQIKERPSSLVRIKAPPERKPGEGVEGGAQ